MLDSLAAVASLSAVPQKKEADYVFYELTRSICPVCLRVIDAHILLRDNKVFMRKRCPEHGLFEALIYGDARAYTANAKFNKAGTIPCSRRPKRWRARHSRRCARANWDMC